LRVSDSRWKSPPVLRSRGSASPARAHRAPRNRFRGRDWLDFTADAEAVLADGGATANAQFIDGIVVVIAPLSGAMAQAAIGGQQITYVPK